MRDYQITYRPHFGIRMRQREFPDGFGEMLLRDADNYYYDTQGDTSVAVKRLHFKGRKREVALIYSVEGDEIAFVSIFPLKSGELRRKIRRGRWVQDETPSNL